MLICYKRMYIWAWLCTHFCKPTPCLSSADRHKPAPNYKLQTPCRCSAVCSTTASKQDLGVKYHLPETWMSVYWYLEQVPQLSYCGGVVGEHQLSSWQVKCLNKLCLSLISIWYPYKGDYWHPTAVCISSPLLIYCPQQLHCFQEETWGSSELSAPPCHIFEIPLEQNLLFPDSLQRLLDQISGSYHIIFLEIVCYRYQRFYHISKSAFGKSAFQKAEITDQQ